MDRVRQCYIPRGVWVTKGEEWTEYGDVTYLEVFGLQRVTNGQSAAMLRT